MNTLQDRIRGSLIGVPSATHWVIPWSLSIPSREYRLVMENEYFRDIIGVTRNADSTVEHVTFIASAKEAPYIRTKPFHQSQRELETLDDSRVLFSIDVILNHELERDLFGYGEGVTVLSPASLVEKLRERLEDSLNNYEKHKKK